MYPHVSVLLEANALKVIAPGPTPETPIFFPDIPFNYAENILHPWMNSDTTAITALDETLVASHYSGRTLVEHVREMSRAMRSFGVKKGDRVAGESRLSAPWLSKGRA